eukprot:196365_1
MKFQTAVLVVVALFAVQMIGECNASRFNMKAGSEKASGIELEHKKSCFKPCNEGECKKGMACKEITVGGLAMQGERCIACVELPCLSSLDCCKRYACSDGQCFRSNVTKKCGKNCTSGDDCDGICPNCSEGICTDLSTATTTTTPT